jgi:hypothetical protein
MEREGKLCCGKEIRENLEIMEIKLGPNFTK